MSATLQPNTPSPNLDAEDAVRPYSAEDFERLSAQYPDLRMELTAEGEITLMAPTWTEGGYKSGEVFGQLRDWSKRDGRGRAYDSSSGFTLPDGSIISPDAAWVATAQMQALPPDQRTKFAHICPFFVAEVRSHNDRLPPLQKKMREYMKNGAQLGFLIDPRLRRVEVYRPNAEPVVLDNPASVSADPELPGFVLELTDILA